ncbi:DUF4960 domain-containing protein [Candidatus Poribacteria bacterium]|nr:DUF4960 domain-containing protein [Candidatus Poribacteria bacterium]
MKNKFYISVLICFISLISAQVIFAAGINMAFLEAEADVPPEDEAEYNWAVDNYNATLIHPAGSGKFEDENGNSVELGDFQVVWWHRANQQDIPPVFLEQATMNAFMDFVESGGSLFLSQVAFHYVFDLELESLEPRFCAPNVDHSPSGIIAAPGEEEHPVFAGFDELGLDPAEGFNIDCYGHDAMCDFYPAGPPQEGRVLGMAYQEPHPQGWFGQVCPLVEYEVGDGTIIISGWRFTVFRSVEEDCEFADAMIKLHENIMGYLGTLAPVEPAGKLSTVWGDVKQ